MTGNARYDRASLVLSLTVLLVLLAISYFTNFPLILLTGYSVMFFLLPKLRSKYSTLAEEQMTATASLAKKLDTRVPEVRLEDRRSGVQVSDNAAVIYLAREDLDETRLRETNFFIGRALVAKATIQRTRAMRLASLSELQQDLFCCY